jgi:hypothetical protein
MVGSMPFLLILDENFYSWYPVYSLSSFTYPRWKHNTQDSIEQARDRSHEKSSSQIFMLDDMQFGGVGSYLR